MMWGLLPIKDWIYLGIIVALVGTGIYFRQHYIDLGESRIKAEVQKATDEQALKDKIASEVAIDSLKAELTKIRADAVSTVPVPLRLCVPRNVPARPVTARPSRDAAGPVSVPGVPEGDTGREIGEAVRDLAYAGAIVAAYRNAIEEWAVKTNGEK